MVTGHAAPTVAVGERRSSPSRAGLRGIDARGGDQNALSAFSPVSAGKGGSRQKASSRSRSGTTSLMRSSSAWTACRTASCFVTPRCLASSSTSADVASSLIYSGTGSRILNIRVRCPNIYSCANAASISASSASPSVQRRGLGSVTIDQVVAGGGPSLSSTCSASKARPS
jgi:hypothetical protein